MIVVSDTSPLRYLIAVDHANILADLFTSVHVPPAVIRELTHAGAPPEVRRWASAFPSWLVVDPLSNPLGPELAASLDQGEAEAIQLAEEGKPAFSFWTNGREVMSQKEGGFR
jgi:predicted nucleic acid-binding protein